jgi:glucose/arabinose dehydrogenase
MMSHQLPMHASRPSPYVRSFAVGAVLLLSACGEHAKLPESAGMGPKPTLPPPHETFIPTIKLASAVGWPPGSHPTPAAGLTVNAFAQGLTHPRRPYVLPNGDVLVAETDSPPKPDDEKGLRGFVQGMIKKMVGSDTPSPNRIVLLRDSNGDGVAETRSVFISGLNSPFGMVLVGDDFYVADTDAVLRFPYTPGATKIDGRGEKVTELPAGTINHHWTKDLTASRDGSRLYATVGSNSNAAENGLAVEQGRAAVWEIDAKTGAHRIFASGLRNPNGPSWAPGTNTLWVAVNERDEIGSDLVPDYITSVKDGGFYGWPFSYYGQHVDTRVKPQNPALVAKAIAPDYAVGNHVAALGLAFADGSRLGPQFSNGAFVSEHGSWNRDPLSGYKVVFVPFAHGKPSGMPVDVLTGFLSPGGKAQGRPVGIAIDKTGALLVADDVGNTVWRVRQATQD